MRMVAAAFTIDCRFHTSQKTRKRGTRPSGQDHKRRNPEAWRLIMKRRDEVTRSVVATTAFSF